MKKILILGGGTAGTMMAHHLVKRKAFKDWQLTLVDATGEHYYQPGFLFLPFGIYQKKDIVKDEASLLPKKIKYIQEEIKIIDVEKNEVEVNSKEILAYDILIIATGSTIVPEETEGLLDSGWRKNIFDFYTADGAEALHKSLANFAGGDLVVHTVEMPVKCPVAPLEFVFLVDWYLTKRNIRKKTNLSYVTPLDGAFTKPVASKALGHLMTEKNINVITDFNVECVEPENNILKAYGGTQIKYDLLVSIPTNMGNPVIERSDLGDDLNFIATDKHTLQANAKDNIFVIGDASDVPTSKAGSVAHFQSELLIENIENYIADKELEPSFDGHANCFIESGFKKALLIDFNYDQEPVQGKFPFAWFGPMSLLKENRMNHWGKLAFRHIYWHILIKARKIPGVSAKMKLAGKKI